MDFNGINNSYSSYDSARFSSKTSDSSKSDALKDADKKASLKLQKHGVRNSQASHRTLIQLLWTNLTSGLKKTVLLQKHQIY